MKCNKTMVSPQQNIQQGMQVSQESGEFKKLKWVLQQRKPSHPNKRWGHTSIVHEGKLLIFGGNLSGSNREAVHRLSCETLENSPLDFPVQLQVRESHSCIARQDSLYIYGGCIGAEVLFFNSTHEWRQMQVVNDLLQIKVSGPSPSWRKIQQKRSIPPRQSHASILVDGKYMMIYGGNSSDDVCYDEFWLLDLETYTWLPVQDVNGRIQAKIGVTMNLIGQNIYAFGGQWGEGDNSYYSNDLSRLSFHGEIRPNNVPTLNITQVETNGLKPCPRNGHASLDYKGKLLIIIGGEGQTQKKTATLFNDIWAFDLRNQTWSELLIENRTIFRPRSNFSANLYKNTIYIFGGFINLSNFKCTDELFTLTLIENRHNLRNQMEHRNSMNSNSPNQKQYCNQCHFQFLNQQRPKAEIQRSILNNNFFQSTPQNIIYAAKFITSPLQALGLIVDSISRIRPQTHKNVKINLTVQPLTTKNKIIILGQMVEKSYLSFCIEGTNLIKQQLQNLVFSYRCDSDDPGFDMKNGLFRLGSEILICQLFEDGMLHGYLLTQQTVHKYVVHLQTLIFELKRHENIILSHYLSQNGINLSKVQASQLCIFVGSLSRNKDGLLQLQKQKQTEFLLGRTSDYLRPFEDFIYEYFLSEKPISLQVHNHKIPLVPFQRQLRAEGTERQQEPTTPYFSKVHLIINQNPDLRGPQSSLFIKLYALGRRVGIFKKFPFISGFIELSDLSSLNFPRSRCESHEVRMALEEEIKVLLQQCKKRESQMPVADLEREIEK